MEIKNFKKAKDEMEEEILIAVDGAIKKFRGKTGYYPSSILVELVNTHTLGSEVLQYVPVSVKCQVDI